MHVAEATSPLIDRSEDSNPEKYGAAQHKRVPATLRVSHASNRLAAPASYALGFAEVGAFDGSSRAQLQHSAVLQ